MIFLKWSKINHQIKNYNYLAFKAPKRTVSGHMICQKLSVCKSEKKKVYKHIFGNKKNISF